MPRKKKVETKATEEPKKKRGRPAKAKTETKASPKKTTRKPRAKKSESKVETPKKTTRKKNTTTAKKTTPTKRRGRPKGSKNKTSTKTATKTPRKRRTKRTPRPKARYAKIIKITPESMDFLVGKEIKIMSETETIITGSVRGPGYEGVVLSFEPSEIEEIAKPTPIKVLEAEYNGL